MYIRVRPVTTIISFHITISIKTRENTYPCAWQYIFPHNMNNKSVCILKFIRIQGHLRFMVNDISRSYEGQGDMKLKII